MELELFVTINNFVTCLTLQMHLVRYKMGWDSNCKSYIVKGTQPTIWYVVDYNDEDGVVVYVDDSVYFYIV